MITKLINQSEDSHAIKTPQNGKYDDPQDDDPEAARNSSFTTEEFAHPSQQQIIVNTVPVGGQRRSGVDSFHGSSSGGTGSIMPVQFRRGVAASSDDTSDGFSLVDDDGDSLAGSEGLSDGPSSGSTRSSKPTPFAQSKQPCPVLFPASRRAVRGARRCFWLVWTVGTVSVTTALWAMATNEGEDRTAALAMNAGDIGGGGKMMFDSKVNLLQQIWKSKLESKLQSMEALGASITSTASTENMTWPYVTLQDFSRRTASLQSFTFWMPLICDDNDGFLGPEIWANFTGENLDSWFYDPGQYLNDTDLVSKVIFQTQPDGRLHTANPASPCFLPVWQHAFPVVPSLVNYDLLSHPQLGPSIQTVLESRQPVLSKTMVGTPPEGGAMLDAILSRQTVTMFLFYPIFAEFSSEPDASDLVGILGTTISWGEILAVSTGDSELSNIYVTIPSGCTNEDDDGVVMKWIDRHSVTVIDSQARISLEDSDPVINSNRWEATVDLSSDLDYYGRKLLLNDTSGGCAYLLLIVQKAEVETIAVLELGNEEDRVPINIVIGVLVLSFSTALAFVWFDLRVRFRDAALTEEAIKSRNIVTSLFPPQVHERLFDSNTGMLTSSVPKPPELQPVACEVGEAASSHAEGPAELKDYVEVPLKGEDERNSHVDRVGDHEQEESTSSSVRGLGLSLGRNLGFVRNSSNDALSRSGHSTIKRTNSVRMDFLARMSGGTGEEPSMQQRFLGFISSDANNLLMQPENSVAEGGFIANDEPIADLFPDATVMFADISGFTAWSSEREPTQVFKLLETIYRSFDRIARKRQVFKVETIGDCYLCVTGLPEPQADHAVIMAKFSKECMSKMRELTRELEVSLGPETSELAMRFGLHSGPVTAGVLRGERSRFQLFGDTVNFASRMESTGQRNRIQASQATADLLILAGKNNWVQPREELVNAKGKGRVQTYWIMPRSNSNSVGGSVRSLNCSVRSLNDSVKSFDGGALPQQPDRINSMIHLKSRPKKSLLGSNHRQKSNRILDSSSSRRDMLTSSQHSQIWTSEQDGEEEDYDGFDDGNRQERLIDWNVQILAGLLRRIAAWRKATSGEVASAPRRGRRQQAMEDDLVMESKEGLTALDEITEIIPMAKPTPNMVRENNIDPESVELPSEVQDQLREYVTMIACMYRDNFFHNFDHASHVLMSSHQLLKRVIGADQGREKGDTSSYTSIIVSDPVTQFAIVFCALIHDVDHCGVPNTQLVKEKAHIALEYKNKSVAEQNSLDLSWDLLMSKEYRDLRRAIFVNKSELERFRKLVVNIILATDIFDNEHIQVRNARFENAFGAGLPDKALSQEDERNLKATVVIECIMQASDVSHTMQHWHVYQRWNEKLFEEMYSAYKVQRGDKDPSKNWYKGELWFFDNYIIPLALKLKECAVFGVASDQFLKNAIENRKEWEIKGEQIVEVLVKRHF